MYVCILTAAIAAVTQKAVIQKKNLHKKETEKDISLCNFFFLKKEVDWVVNDWVYSSSTFIDQVRDCRCGI